MPAAAKADFPFASTLQAFPGSTLLRNDVYALAVLIEKGTGPRRGTTYTVTVAPDVQSEPESSLTTEDLSEAKAAYASGWISSAARDIGLGFHPDTPAGGYGPPLNPALAAQYDAMIGYCHDHLENPYEDAYEGWKAAGLVSDEAKP